MALDEDLELLDPRPSRASLSSSIFNLLNTMIGAGMLGLPHAFAACGWAVGTVLLVVAAGLAGFGLHLLSEAADATRRPASFYSVAEAAVPGLGLLMDVSVFGVCFGAACGYLIIVGDSMPAALASFGVGGAARSRQLWVVVAAAVVAPLAFLREVDQLRHTSLAALACVALIALLIVAFAVGTDAGLVEPCDAGALPCRGAVVATAPDARAVLGAVPVFVFAYTCHQNVFSITNELREPTRARTLRLFGATLGAGGLCFLLVGAAGYATFGARVASDILLSYPRTPLVAVARVALSLVVSASYPLMSHPARASLLSLLGAAARRAGLPPPAGRAFGALSAAHLVGSAAIALAVDDLGLVLAIVGAAARDQESARPASPHHTPHPAHTSDGSGRTRTPHACRARPYAGSVGRGRVVPRAGATVQTTLQYILPGLCYCRLVRHGPAPKRWLAAAQLVLGVVLVPTSLYCVLYPG